MASERILFFFSQYELTGHFSFFTDSRDSCAWKEPDTHKNIPLGSLTFQTALSSGMIEDSSLALTDYGKVQSKTVQQYILESSGDSVYFASTLACVTILAGLDPNSNFVSYAFFPSLLPDISGVFSFKPTNGATSFAIIDSDGGEDIIAERPRIFDYSLSARVMPLGMDVLSHELFDIPKGTLYGWVYGACPGQSSPFHSSPLFLTSRYWFVFSDAEGSLGGGFIFYPETGPMKSCEVTDHLCSHSLCLTLSVLDCELCSHRFPVHIYSNARSESHHQPTSPVASLITRPRA